MCNTALACFFAIIRDLVTFRSLASYKVCYLQASRQIETFWLAINPALFGAAFHIERMQMLFINLSIRVIAQLVHMPISARTITVLRNAKKSRPNRSIKGCARKMFRSAKDQSCNIN